MKQHKFTPPDTILCINCGKVEDEHTMKESDLVKQIKEYLDLKHYLWIRNNTGALKVENRFVKFGNVGSPDFLVFAHGETYAIEAKATKGKLSEAQLEWRTKFRSTGAGTYIEARSLEDVTKWL